MPHIPLPAHLPGITGLLEYRQDTAAPIRTLTQILLRGESSLSEGERELIATMGGEVYPQITYSCKSCVL